jgi:hypothetical protein
MSSATSYFARSLRLRKDHQIDRSPLTPSDSDLTLDELYDSTDSFASSFNEGTSTDTDEDEGEKVQVVVQRRRNVLGRASTKGKGKGKAETARSAASGVRDASGDGEFIDPFPDFQWMTTEEPHRSRRMAILKAHPEVSIPLLTLSPRS